MRVPIKSALSSKLLFYHIKQMVVYFSALFLCIAELKQAQCMLTLWCSNFSISIAFEAAAELTI